MTFQIGAICVGLVLGATLIVTFILELIKQDGLYNGTILNLVVIQYKINIWYTLIVFLWLAGIVAAIELILTFYDGARMRYRLRIDFFEQLEDFYYYQLPEMKLVYDTQSIRQLPPSIQQVPQQQVPQQQVPQQQVPQQQVPQQQVPQQQVPIYQDHDDELPPRRRSARTRRASH